jgi:hypothetical protein
MHGTQILDGSTWRTRKTERARIVVLGVMGRIPLAGVVWQVLHYLEGFRRLGFEVYYVEDTDAWPFDPAQNTVTDDCTYAVNYLGRLMTAYGLSDCWAYCAAAPLKRTYGLSESQLLRVFERADALINLTGSTVLRDEHLRVPIRVYLETDPVLPQIEVARDNPSYVDLLAAHTHHFSYGENLGQPDCGVPVGRFHYRATRQPIVLDWWRPSSSVNGNPMSSAGCFTTVANWRQTGKDFEWNGETYTWSKHHEFLKFIDLPRRTAQPLELAVALKSKTVEESGAWAFSSDEDAEAIRLLTAHGWRVVNAMPLSKEILPYRDYILSSRGEFTVAKDQNVRLRSGWFSDRSACYLAAGRPVINQDTRFGEFLPTGAGLFAFHTIEEILAAFEAINSDYEKHCRAALAIGEEYFRAETVLAQLVQDTGM